MGQKDYILREIERLGIVFARIFGRITGRTTSMAEVQRDLHAAAGSIGLDLELAHRVTPETLVLLVAPDGTPEPTRCWFFAESLFLEGLEAHLSGQDEQARDLLTRARMLFALLHGATYVLAQLPEAAGRVARIDELLSAMSPN